MEITEFGPDDHETVIRYVDLVNAVRRTDSPWSYPLTVRENDGLLRYHWDLEPPRVFLATDGDDAVGYGELFVSEYDNLKLAWLEVEIHPEHRRRGHGSALLEFLIEQTRAAGRTSIGTGGWESEATRAFAARHDLPLKSVAVNRRQFPAEVDWTMLDKLYDEAAPHAASYELVRWPRRTPDDELPALAELTAAINDAPLDDLEIEDEVFTPERIRAYEHAHEARGILLHRLVARHRETGELAGQTVVGVETERPWLGEQHDTSVVAAHRGNRLGLVMKIGLLRWLREEQPQLERSTPGTRSRTTT